MKYLKKIDEDKIIKFSDYEPTKYNGTILVNNIMEWLRSYMLDKSDDEDYIRIPLSKFLDETNIEQNKLRTFIDEQEKSNRISSFKIKIEDDNIVFYEFKKDHSKKVWEEKN